MLHTSGDNTLMEAVADKGGHAVNSQNGEHCHNIFSCQNAPMAVVGDNGGHDSALVEDMADSSGLMDNNNSTAAAHLASKFQSPINNALVEIVAGSCAHVDKSELSGHVDKSDSKLKNNIIVENISASKQGLQETKSAKVSKVSACTKIHDSVVNAVMSKDPGKRSPGLTDAWQNLMGLSSVSSENIVDANNAEADKDSEEEINLGGTTSGTRKTVLHSSQLDPLEDKRRHKYGMSDRILRSMMCASQNDPLFLMKSLF